MSNISIDPVADTYPTPEHGWTCFHCGETFMYPNDARRHFGKKPISITACVLTAEDRKAVRMVRYLEGELETYKRYYHEGRAMTKETLSSNPVLTRDSPNAYLVTREPTA